MKQITLIPKRFSKSLLARQGRGGCPVYYLDDDMEYMVQLKNRIKDSVELKSLSSLFDETYQDAKGDFIRIIADLNKKHNSLEWWSMSLSSRNLGTTRLYLNATYLLCVLKMIKGHPGDWAFVVESPALMETIAREARKLGYHAVIKRRGLNKVLSCAKCLFVHSLRIIYFLGESMKSKIVASIMLKTISPRRIEGKKRAVIRTWVAINKNGDLQDRNFGPLTEWLEKNDHEVCIYPMFYYFFPVRKTFDLIRKYKLSFIIPDQYLSVMDYLGLLMDNIRIFRRKMDHIQLKGLDITGIFRESLENEMFNRGLLKLNLSYSLMKRLAQRGVEIDAFYYSFENNSNEKVFILGARKYMPKAKVIGFQHTTFFPNQISYQLIEGETDYHPLPDKIICSGPIYIDLHSQVGFPRDLLLSGPNLRFGSVHKNIDKSTDEERNGQKVIMVPISGIYNPVFELFIKLNQALNNRDDYKVLIRNHPLLLPKDRLIKFLDGIGMKNYEFADEGDLQDWLAKSDIAVSSGWSITAVESAAMGLPVIRIVPDNTFNCDPLVWPDYPLSPVNDIQALREQIDYIEKVLKEDKDNFKRLGNRILPEFFSEPNDENMKAFLQ